MPPPVEENEAYQQALEEAAEFLSDTHGEWHIDKKRYDEIMARVTEILNKGKERPPENREYETTLDLRIFVRGQATDCMSAQALARDSLLEHVRACTKLHVAHVEIIRQYTYGANGFYQEEQE